MTLAEGLIVELDRAIELLVAYRSLPDGAGAFGAPIIKKDIMDTIAAIVNGDTVMMLQMHEKLRGLE